MCIVQNITTLDYVLGLKNAALFGLHFSFIYGFPFSKITPTAE